MSLYSVATNFRATIDKTAFPLIENFQKRDGLYSTMRIGGVEKLRVLQEKNTGSDSGSWKRCVMAPRVLKKELHKPPKSPLSINDCRKYAEMVALGVPVHPHCGFFYVQSLKCRSVFQKK